MDGKTIKARTDARASERSNIDSMWDIIQRFIAPFRANLFGNKDGEGNIDWKRRELYDSTAIMANSNLAANVHGALTNSALKWYKYTFQQNDLNAMYEAKEWLEECDDINYMSLQKSNFDLEASEIYLDLTSFGNGTMVSLPVEDNTNALDSIDYKTIPVDECYFDFDVNGLVINFYRVLNWTTDQIVAKFGKEAILSHEAIKADYESNDRSQNKHKLIFCIYKRAEQDSNFNPYQIASIDSRPYGSKYIVDATSEQIGEDGGHHEMPVFAPRWRRVSGSDWGFSPSMIAIWNVLTLNQMKELIMVAGEKVLDPTIMTTKKGVFGDIDLSSGGVVVVQDIEKSMKAFESRARFDVSALQQQDLIKSIQEAYFVNELQLKESPAMTAAEVHARIQLMQRLLGPTFGRLHTQFLSPLVERNFMINFRYKKFPPMPQSLMNRKADLKIEYLGNLAKAQRMDAAASVQRWMGGVTAMADAYPQALDIPNIDNVVRNMAEDEGIPTKLMNNDTVVKKTRKQKSEQMAEMQQAEMMRAKGEAAEAMGTGAQAMKGVADMEESNEAA